MTDQQTELRHHEDGYDAGSYDEAGYDAGSYGENGYGENGYGENGYVDAGLDQSLDDWDTLDDEWDAYVATPRPPAPARASRPWYRDPRWLFGLIALAAAALVVATVLLVTGRGSGEIPTAPGLTTRTPASTTSAPGPRTASPRESAPSSSSTTPTSASPPSEDPTALDVPAPMMPMPSAAEAPPESPAPAQNKSPAGPRINVTRTPMSFSPGKH